MNRRTNHRVNRPMRRPMRGPKTAAPTTGARAWCSGLVIGLLAWPAGVGALPWGPGTAPPASAEHLVPLPAHATAADTLPAEPHEIPGLLASDEGRARGIAAIHSRAAGLPSERATAWVQLLAVAEKTAPRTGALAARALLAAEEGGGARGAGLLLEALDGAGSAAAPGALAEAEGADRAALLAFAAHLVEGPEPGRAFEIRHRLLEEHPDAPEAQEARFRVARYLVNRDGDRARAQALLEELIVGAPNHPLAPAARRLLQEIRGGAR